MKISISGTVALTLCALAVAGCQSSRFSSVGGPAPLNPAPAGTVVASQLPPPSPTGPTDPSSFPPPPGGTTTPEQTEDVAALDPSAGDTPIIEQPPADAPELTANSMVGAWKAGTGGSSCQIFMSLTKWTGGYRAASRGCPGEASEIAAWEVAGKQVLIKDRNGNTLARLYSSGTERFDGQMTNGQKISLFR